MLHKAGSVRGILDQAKVMERDASGKAVRMCGTHTDITELMERPLEPSYAAAAHRRVEAGLPPSTSTRSVTIVIIALVVGFVLAVAALSLRSTTSVAWRPSRSATAAPA